MVLLAAAVCTKAGKAIVSRQFVEMTRTRIEGLLAAFPKLMNTGKQHTFVETESVRYVYQPMEKLYMVLITTKNSNILEDLETLRLFSRVIPEYCRALEENEISEHCFDLIFAFDEIVALGYRENVNLAQIRTFTEMDSHEEKVFRAVRETQEREAKAEMRRKAKELQQARRDAERQGKKAPGFGGFGSSTVSGGSTAAMITDTIIETDKPKVAPAPTRPSGPSKALKLGAKGKDVNIEYELQEDNLELNDVVITIPLPSGVGAPVIGEIDGEYRHDSRRNTLEWCLPVIDAKNKSGSLEFSIAGQPNDFFPVQVSFISKKNYCNIQVTKVTQVDGNSPVRFSTETTFLVDKYEIL
uniref:Coatomer subunit delta n=1 Tax=Rousettus aegyptiacus TaxID=9407 RepID=A0A7J8GV55_ROUAE|nr:archain 1 [Rousettus aegyptiacus]